MVSTEIRVRLARSDCVKSSLITSNSTVPLFKTLEIISRLPEMEPWMSWAIVAALGCGAAYYYAQSGKPKSASQGQTQPTSIKHRQGRGQQSSAKSGARDGAGNLAGKTGSKKKNKARQAPQSEQSSIPDGPNDRAADSEPEEDDHEWAEQLRAAQRGVSVNGPAKVSKPPKTKADKRPQNGATVAPQPAKSQTLTNGGRQQEGNASTASINHQQPSAKDVLDMLEAPSAGPSVVRLTGEEKVKKQQQRGPSPEKETKKQRQNRKKVEEKKAVREQEEKERKVLQETQRRTAREARGEPAKNGVAAAMPQNHVWSDGSASENRVAANGRSASNSKPTNGQVSLLDTFDHDAVSNTSSNEPQTTSTTPATAASTTGSDVATEDSQPTMRNGNNENSGWNEVGKSKKAKKRAAPASNTKDARRHSPATSGESVSAEVLQALSNGASASAGYGDAFTKGMTSKKFHELDSDWFVE